MKKPSGKSWDSVATRDLRGAITRQDREALGRALARNANPNDPKKINPWSPSLTPLMQAASEGFQEAIPLLVRCGARRRGPGKGMSVFATAIVANKPQSFQTLCSVFGTMTAFELRECCTVIRSLRGTDAQVRREQWTRTVLEAFDRRPLRLAPSLATAIVMEFLGGESVGDPIQIGIVRQFMDKGIISADLISRSYAAKELAQWGEVLSKRLRDGDAEEAKAVDLLHELKVPFDAMVSAMQGEVPVWLQEQVARANSARLDETTIETQNRRPRARL